jgi:hypothetical protein
LAEGSASSDRAVTPSGLKAAALAADRLVVVTDSGETPDSSRPLRMAPVIDPVPRMAMGGRAVVTGPF